MESLSDHAIEARIREKILKWIVRKTFSKWKSVTNHSQSFRSFQEEHQARKSRIDSLLGRLSNLAVSDRKDDNNRSTPKQLPLDRLKKSSAHSDNQNPQYTGRINEYLTQLGEESPDMYSHKKDQISSPKSSSSTTNTNRPSKTKIDPSSFEQFAANHGSERISKTQPQQQPLRSPSHQQQQQNSSSSSTAKASMTIKRPPTSEVTANNRSHSALRPSQQQHERSNSLHSSSNTNHPVYSPASSTHQEHQQQQQLQSRKSQPLTSRSNPDTVINKSNSLSNRNNNNNSCGSSSARKQNVTSTFNTSTKVSSERPSVRASSVSNMSSSRTKAPSSSTSSSSSSSTTTTTNTTSTTTHSITNNHRNNINHNNSNNGISQVRPNTNYDSNMISKSPTATSSSKQRSNSNRDSYNNGNSSRSTNDENKRHFFPNTESINGTINCYNNNNNHDSSTHRSSTAMPNSSRSGISTVTSSEAYESRAADRWERTIALRKLAEERIIQKKLQQEERIHQREEEETKESYLLREQKRAELAMKRRKHSGEPTPITSSSNSIDDQQHQQLQRARKHYKKQLLINWGIVPWMKLCQLARQQRSSAIAHYNHQLIRRCWYSLQGYMKALRLEKQKMDIKTTSLVISHYRRTLCRQVWKKWKSYGKILRAKALTVWKKSSKHSILNRTFRTWKISLEKSKRKNLMKWQSAGLRGNIALKRYYWSLWSQYMHENHIQKEIDKRTELTWNKVQGWLK